MSKVKFFAHDGCWEWTGRKSRTNYGICNIKFDNEQYYLIHRIFYRLANGSFNKSLHVLHECDNPTCVNPDHLFLGTHLDNMRDMAKKVRSHFSKKTHCPSGHEYNTENTRIYKGYIRVCKACDYARLPRKKYVFTICAK